MYMYALLVCICMYIYICICKYININICQCMGVRVFDCVLDRISYSYIDTCVCVNVCMRIRENGV